MLTLLTLAGLSNVKKKQDIFLFFQTTKTCPCFIWRFLYTLVNLHVYSTVFSDKGENSYHCKGINYGRITKTEVIEACNNRACSELQQNQFNWTVLNIKTRIFQEKSWQQSLKGTSVNTLKDRKKSANLVHFVSIIFLQVLLKLKRE